ncbi:MAG: hypothetical protein AMXMBFR34_11430 [Myxococcaceae bacterium]
MKKHLISTEELLHFAGLERRHSFWSRALPIAAGVSAGLVAGALVTAALLTPPRRERLTQGMKGLLRRGAPATAAPMHHDAPGAELPKSPGAHA